MEIGRFDMDGDGVGPSLKHHRRRTKVNKHHKSGTKQMLSQKLQELAAKSNWQPDQAMFNQQTMEKMDERFAASMLPKINTRIGELTHTKDPLLPNAYHYIYPTQDYPDCLLQGTCIGSTPTHDNLLIYACLRWLCKTRHAENDFVIGVPFDYNSIDFQTPGLVEQRFMQHLSKNYVPNKRLILVMECGACGNGQSDLFSSKISWGHRTMVVANPKSDGKTISLHQVEYYDSLGDQGMNPDSEHYRSGIAVSSLVINRLILPLMKQDDPWSDLMLIPHSETLTSMCKTKTDQGAPMCANVAAVSKKKNLYFQHADEYFCQNWVVFFADACMWRIGDRYFNGEDWLRLSNDDSLSKFRGRAQGKNCLEADLPCLVFFHLYHLRRIFPRNNKVTVPTELYRLFPDFFREEQMTIHGFGIRLGDVTRSAFKSYLGISYEGMQKFARRKKLFQNVEMILQRYVTPAVAFPADDEHLLSRDKHETCLDPLALVQMWYISLDAKHPQDFAKKMQVVTKDRVKQMIKTQAKQTIFVFPDQLPPVEF
jgi:hypothetical protein